MHRPDVPVVVDPKLSAPRGAEFSAGALVDEGPLDDSVPVHYYPEGEGAEAASTTTAIDASNKGFQLLQKMGWKGKGLGRKEDGIAEPIRAGVEAGVRLGLGKQQEDDKYTAAENIQRKKLEVELQIDEDPERTKKREAEAQREAMIRQDVTQILKTFYCQVCNKQYTSAMELEEHLSSYDHHHKKRLAEARAAELERTRDERHRKEVKRQQREQQRLEEQIRKAQAAAAAKQGMQQQPGVTVPLHPSPPPPPPPPPPEAAAGNGGGGWASTAATAAPGSSSGWSDSPAPPPPPPDSSAGLLSHAVAPSSITQAGGSSGGWSGTAVAGVAAPPPPPPVDGPPEAVTVGAGMSFGLLKPGASAGRGGGRLAGRGGVLAGVKRPAAALKPDADASGRAGLGCSGGGGLGFKAGLGFSGGGGLGFKAGLGSKKAGMGKVTAAFGDSSDEEAD